MTDIRDQWARAVIKSDLKDELKVTCWAIREYANRTGTASMGVKALARNIGVHQRTIQRRLNKIVAAGFLERIPGRGVRGPGGTTTLTRLRLPERSNDTQGVITSTPQSNDSQYVSTLPNKVCHKGSQGVAQGGPSGGAPNAALTKKNQLEPVSAAAPAPDGALGAPDNDALDNERNRKIVAMLKAGEPRFRIETGYDLMEGELEALEAAIKDSQQTCARSPGGPTQGRQA